MSTSGGGKRSRRSWTRRSAPGVAESRRGGTRPGRSGLKELGLDLDLENLADLGAGQVGPDLDLLGSLDAAQPVLDEGADLVPGHGLARAELDDGGDPLAPLLVGQPDDRAVLHGGMGQQD